MRHVVFRILVLGCAWNVCAQDSTKTLRLKDFLQLVAEYHPIMKQSDLMADQARHDVGITRGNFDPKYDFDFTRKNFKGTIYYDYLDHGLKIPTWIGADVKAGFEKNSGVYVNPTNYTPPEGLMYLGIDIPVGKGLWMDERRALLRQAQAAMQLTEGERKKLELKLYSMAIKDYLDWLMLEEKQKLLNESVRISEIRLNGIRERVAQGDLPSIDSVEALTLYNDRLNEWTLNENALFVQRNKVELYFWNENGIPLEMESSLKPVMEEEFLKLPEVQKLKDSIDSGHPEIIKLRAKVTHYHIEQRWRRNDVLPGIVFTAKYLNTPDHPLRNDFNSAYIQNNYKLQVALVQPLFIRKEIHKMKLSATKLAMARNDLSIASREIVNDIDNAYVSVNAWKNYKDRQKQNASMLKQLFDGEQMRFNNGESTVFLVNSRESKWLEGSSKEIESKMKYEKAILEVYMNAGIVPEFK